MTDEAMRLLRRADDRGHDDQKDCSDQKDCNQTPRRLHPDRQRI